jgi:hypothetical protein
MSSFLPGCGSSIGPPDGIYLLFRADREELGDLAAALSQFA